MNNDQFAAALQDQPAYAILRTDHEQRAAPAMRAAIAGGFRVVEFTMTIPGALDRIAEFSREAGLVVGAGTVLDEAQLHQAVDAGAQFVVSPVVDEAVIKAAVAMDVAVIPGCQTPSEFLHAHRLGARFQKLFPAPGIGPAFVKACLGPLPFLNIIPTHGIHENNAASYLKAGAKAVGFTASLFQAGDIDAERYDAIQERAQRLLASLK